MQRMTLKHWHGSSSNSSQDCHGKTIKSLIRPTSSWQIQLYVRRDARYRMCRVREVARICCAAEQSTAVRYGMMLATTECDEPRLGGDACQQAP